MHTVAVYQIARSSRAMTTVSVCVNRSSSGGGLSRFFDLVGDITGSRAARPGDDLEAPVAMLADRGAAFHPVAAIDVAQPELVVDRGVMDVAANDALGVVAPRFQHQGLLEFADVVDGVL